MHKRPGVNSITPKIHNERPTQKINTDNPLFLYPPQTNQSCTRTINSTKKKWYMYVDSVRLVACVYINRLKGYTYFNFYFESIVLLSRQTLIQNPTCLLAFDKHSPNKTFSSGSSLT